MFLNKFILIVITLLISISSYGNDAVITKLKGKVTILLPHQKEAINATMGLKIPEDSSIVTYDKSFISIVYEDKSMANIGSNSKVVITSILKKDVPSVLALLKGSIRAKVIKNYDFNKITIEEFKSIFYVEGIPKKKVSIKEKSVLKINS